MRIQTVTAYAALGAIAVPNVVSRVLTNVGQRMVSNLPRLPFNKILFITDRFDGRSALEHCAMTFQSHHNAEGSRSATACSAGFTLIEMLVVVAVLGMAMGLMATSGPMRSRAIDMQTVVEQVAQMARLAHARAVVDNRVVRLMLDLPAHTLRIDDMRPAVLPPTMRVAMTAVSGESVGGALTTIRFNPDGSTTGGRIELAEGPRRALVGVDWLTGRVSVVQLR